MSRGGACREILAEQLARGLRQLDPGADWPRDALLDYLNLLVRWNRAYNLSAVREPEAMIGLHLLDSLSTLPYIETPSLLDVGSGAGLPGIPLALCRPGLRVTLLDSNGKKTRFLEQVRLQLGVPNLTVVRCRIQEHRPAEAYATVISRAYARLDTFVTQALPLLAPEGVILAMKGRFQAAEESAGLPGGLTVESLPLTVPGLDARRTLVRIQQATATGRA